MAQVNTAERARLDYEGGQTVTAMGAITDGGDHQTFNSGASLFSKKTGFEPVVRPDGLATGGKVTAAISAANDAVDVAALTCNLAGTVTTVGSAVDTLITRGSAANPAKVNSITVTSAGAIAVVAGTNGTAIVEARGVAGGAPLIPVGSIEIAQVRTTSDVAAQLASSEIFATVGVHVERYDFPLFDVLPGSGQVKFLTVLPLIHVGVVTKGVSASFAAPIFSEVPLAVDFVPPENSHSLTSTQVYGTTVGSTSSTLNQGSFTAYLSDGVSDPLVALKNEVLWFKFFPDRFKANNLLTQGKLGINRTFPAGSSIQAACTISADAEATEVAA